MLSKTAIKIFYFFYIKEVKNYNKISLGLTLLIQRHGSFYLSIEGRGSGRAVREKGDKFISISKKINSLYVVWHPFLQHHQLLFCRQNLFSQETLEVNLTWQFATHSKWEKFPNQNLTILCAFFLQQQGRWEKSSFSISLFTNCSLFFTPITNERCEWHPEILL